MVDGLGGVSGGQVGVAAVLEAEEEQLPGLAGDLARAEAAQLPVQTDLGREMGLRYL